MTSALRPKLAQEKIDKIIELSQKGLRHKDIAKELEINTVTVGKYIRLHNKELYTEKPSPPDKPDYTDRNRDCQEVSKKEIQIFRGEEEGTEKKREGKQSNNEDRIAEKKANYTSKLDNLINLLLIRYEKDYYRIHPNFLSRDIGIFIDKFNVLTGNNPTVDNRSIIFASFGSNEDMLKLIKQIQDSTTKTG